MSDDTITSLERRFHHDYAAGMALAAALDVEATAETAALAGAPPSELVTAVAELLIWRHLPNELTALTHYYPAAINCVLTNRETLVQFLKTLWSHAWKGPAQAEEAREILSLSMATATNATLPANLARLSAFLSDPPRAMAAARHGLALGPETGLAYSGLGYAQLAAGGFADAVRSFDHAMALGLAPDEQVDVIAAIAAIAAGDAEDGERRLAAMDNSDLDLWVNSWRAMARLSRGDVQGAMALQSETRITALNAATLNANLAVCLAAIGREAEAKAMRRRAEESPESFTLTFLDHIRPYARSWLPSAEPQLEPSCSP